MSTEGLVWAEWMREYYAAALERIGYRDKYVDEFLKQSPLRPWQ